MVDLHQSPRALSGERSDPATADQRADNGWNATGGSERVKPVVVGERSPGEFSILVEQPRLFTEQDVLWVVWLGRKRYPKNYDPWGAEGWLRNAVLRQPLMFLPMRTQNAFCVSMVSVKPWTPSENECHVAALCADDGAMTEAIKLLRWSVEWA